MRVPNVMEVHPGVPAKTVAEFIAYGKANPGKINGRLGKWHLRSSVGRAVPAHDRSDSPTCLIAGRRRR